MSLGLRPGDEVIDSFTYIATTEVIALLGLKPVFVEVDRDTFVLTLKESRMRLPIKPKQLSQFTYMDRLVT